MVNLHLRSSEYDSSMEDWSSLDIASDANTVVSGSEIEDNGETIDRIMCKCITRLQLLFFDKREKRLAEMRAELEAVVPRLPKDARDTYAAQLEFDTIELIREDLLALRHQQDEVRFETHQLLRAAMQYEAEKGSFVL